MGHSASFCVDKQVSSGNSGTETSAEIAEKCMNGQVMYFSVVSVLSVPSKYKIVMTNRRNAAEWRKLCTRVMKWNWAGVSSL